MLKWILLVCLFIVLCSCGSTTTGPLLQEQVAEDTTATTGGIVLVFVLCDTLPPSWPACQPSPRRFTTTSDTSIIIAGKKTGS